MIIIVHDQLVPIKILNQDFKPVVDAVISKNLVKTFINTAHQFSDQLLVWCENAYVDHLNPEAFSSVFHHNRIMASYSPNTTDYLPKAIGYIDRTCFINVNKNVTYPTWLMSSMVGGVHASVINTIKKDIKYSNHFDYFINSLSKNAMTQGLFCYSEPKLLNTNTTVKAEVKQASTVTLFKFVKQHYKWVWVFFLSISYLIYEKKFTFLKLFKSLFYSKLPTDFNLDVLPITSSKKGVNKKEIDVIIPTIGRKHYLYEVLKDLEAQTIHPKNVIIVEQNPLEGSVSELEYLKTQDWSFNIKHTFTHQSGVCNARNIALDQLKSDWVFFADDDIRFESDFFEKTFDKIDKYKIDVINYLCLQPDQKQSFFKVEQTIVFGSGSSFCNKKVIEGLKFNMQYEFGFGEDSDFGMQIRNKGFDVIFVPDIKITHLKAPIGGYRTKVKQLWADDVIPPKPSPTIMLLNQTYFTSQQLLGYKLLLGLRSFKTSKTKNPIRYIKQYKKQWERSQFWSAKLSKNEV